jgi:hypothetical protein
MSFIFLLLGGWLLTFAVVGIGVYLATRNYYDPPNPPRP